MRFFCMVCCEKERTHIGINGGEHVTLCDSKECWDKFKASRGDGVKIIQRTATVEHMLNDHRYEV